jgi:phage-related minor tail protein
MLLLSVLISSLIPFIADSAEENTRWVFEWIVPFINIIAAIVIVLFSIPSIIGGGALLQGKSWALTLVLILGCFKLFSFPIGTAIGIYTIWVYAEDKKSVSEKTA